MGKFTAPVKLSIVYLVSSVLWIIFSSDLAEKFANGNVGLLTSVEKYKGVSFVILSAFIIYFMSSR